jgi:hypothetical protein
VVKVKFLSLGKVEYSLSILSIFDRKPSTLNHTPFSIGGDEGWNARGGHLLLDLNNKLQKMGIFG